MDVFTVFTETYHADYDLKGTVCSGDKFGLVPGSRVAKCHNLTLAASDVRERRRHYPVLDFYSFDA